MPTRNGEYIVPDKDDVVSDLVDNVESNIDEASVEFGDYTRALLEGWAETLIENQHEALKRVYEGNFLDTAEGNELDLLLDPLVLSRQDATRATGVELFSHEGFPSQDYTIPTETEVTTDEEEAIPFETTTEATISLFDDFDGGLSAWSGQTGNFSTSGSQLVMDDSSASTGDLIYLDGLDVNRGDTYEIECYPEDGVIGILLDFVDTDNYNEIVLDSWNEFLEAYYFENGTENKIGELDLDALDDLTTGESHHIPENEKIHVTLDTSINGKTDVILYESVYRNNEIVRTSFDLHDHDGDAVGVKVRAFPTDDVMYVQRIGKSEAVANIRALNGGTQTNVGDNTINRQSSSTAGVASVTNPIPTGDLTLDGVNGVPLMPGADEESDEEYRERARNSSSLGGAGTVAAVGQAIDDTNGVQSVKVYQNKEDSTDNAGLSAHAIEPVVLGGDVQDIAQSIHDVVAATVPTDNNVYGTDGESHTVSDPYLSNDPTYRISRANVVSLDINITVYTNDVYIGRAELRDRVVKHVGGTLTNGDYVPGLDIGESMYVDVLRDDLVGPQETGVVDVRFDLIDTDNDGNGDINTTGADTVEVTNGEVLQADAADGSINITQHTI